MGTEARAPTDNASPEMPEQEVSDPSVGQSPLQQESSEVTVQIRLVLQDLDQLDQVLQQFIVTVDG